MKPSLCRCGALAEYSVCMLVSTLGLRPRRQKCGRAEVFCAVCIQNLLSKRWGMEASGVQESLRQAYTAIAEYSGAESDAHRASECGIDRAQIGTNESGAIRCGKR